MGYNILRYRARSDILLTSAYVFCGAFTFFDLLITLNITQGNVIEPELLYIIHLARILGPLIGVVIIVFEIEMIINMTGIEYSFKKWMVITGIVIYTLISLTFIFNYDVINLNGYPSTIVTLPYFSLIPIVLLFILLATISGRRFFEFVSIVSAKKYRRWGKEFVFTIIIFLGLGFYYVNVVIRTYFGFNWIIIIISDILAIIAISAGIISSFVHSFGETMALVLNLEAIFISHFSGRLVYHRVFVEKGSTNPEIISAFLTTIDTMLKEIREKGEGVERLILHDDSQIIFSEGPYFTGIFITKRFNKQYKLKLGALVSKIHELKDFDIAKWDGETEVIGKNIEKFLADIF